MAKERPPEYIPGSVIIGVVTAVPSPVCVAAAVNLSLATWRLIDRPVVAVYCTQQTVAHYARTTHKPCLVLQTSKRAYSRQLLIGRLIDTLKSHRQFTWPTNTLPHVGLVGLLTSHTRDAANALVKQAVREAINASLLTHPCTLPM